MNILRELIRFLISATVLISTLYAVTTACIAVLKLSGKISDDRPMFIDMETPTWTDLFIIEVACLAVIGIGLYSLRYFRNKAESQG